MCTNALGCDLGLCVLLQVCHTCKEVRPPQEDQWSHSFCADDIFLWDLPSAELNAAGKDPALKLGAHDSVGLAASPAQAPGSSGQQQSLPKSPSQAGGCTPGKRSSASHG